jgi:hypothetical protein
MSATTDDQLDLLILFSLAALFLLIRLHALDEQATWARRRIGDPSAVGSIYLRGGTVFVIVAILGSLVLTASAKSAPLAGAWDDLKPWLLDVSSTIEAVPADAREQPRHRRASSSGPTPRSAARGPPTRGSRRRSSGRRATTSATTGGAWPTTISTTTAGSGPAATDTIRVPTRPRHAAPQGHCEAVAKPGTKDVTFSVAPDQLRGTYALSPAVPLRDRPPRRPPRRRQAGLLPGGRDQPATTRTRSRPGSRSGATTTAA